MITIGREYLARLASSDAAQVDQGRTDPYYKLSLRVAWDTICVFQTIEYGASYVPYYSRLRQASSFGPIRSLDDFLNVPTLSKTTIQADPQSFLSSDVAPSYIRCTSGTMGRRLTIYGCAEEQENRRALLQIKSPGKPNRDGDILLRVLPPLKRLIASNALGLVPQLTAIYDSDHQYGSGFDFDDFIAQCIWDRYFIPGTNGKVTILHVTPPSLFAILTERLKVRGFPLSRAGLRGIALTGAFVSRKLRSAILDDWQTTAITSYSCTEIGGEARECRLTPGVFHFDESIYAETLDCRTGQPCGLGAYGRLVLTSLYPFQIAMPFIRYDTGDLAQPVEVPCACGAVGASVRILGRREHCFSLDGNDNQIIGSTQMEDLLCQFSEIPTLPYPKYYLSTRECDRGKVVTLDLETLHVSVLDASDLSRRVQCAMLAAFPWIESSIDRISLDVRLFNKGDLTQYFQLTRDR